MLESASEQALGEILPAIAKWVESKRADKGGALNTNVMTVGLIIATKALKEFPLVEDQYLAKSQVKGLSGAAISKLLMQFGEERSFTSEGGRTSRGSMDLARELAQLLNSKFRNYSSMAAEDVSDVFIGLQEWFIALLRRDYFDRQRIDAEIDPNRPACLAVSSLLIAAAKRGGTTAGAVAQHLVGASLSLTFPNETVGSEGYTTADQQTSRSGDFQIGDTPFHVTMSPSERLMSQRCKSNLSNGFRPMVLVPVDRVAAARQLAENAEIGNRVGIESIESFIGTNLETLATYNSANIKSGIRKLLETYNERVRVIEPDPSLQIEIPANL